jgi:hypothetical protein
MRRLSAAGAAIVVCLALGGVPALAQDGAVAVTATQDCSWEHTWDWGACTYTASDPRVTGTLTLTGRSEVTVPGTYTPGLEWLTVTLQGPDGTWTGHYYVFHDTAGTAHVLGVFAGDGSYEGWTYVDSVTVPGSGDIVGVLYPGPLPPPFELMPAATGE